MPLPSSGSISADDLNEELGNSPGTQIDFESAAISLLETATRPHGMGEFYGTSLGEDFLFSDWDGSVSITEFGVITATVGNATSRTINTSNFLAVTSATPRSVSVTIVTPSTFNGESVSNAGESKTGNKSVTQPAVGRYLSISANDTSLAGDDTSVSLTVTDTYYNNASQTPWEITTETISANSLPVVSFLPITGTGTETVNVTVADNPNGSTRNIRFKVTGTVGGKSSFVDVSQASYTPAVPPTVSIDSVLPSAPFSYNGVNQVVFTISRTIASSFTAQISPGIDSNGAIFSTSQPSGITRNSSTSISGTNNTFYVQIPARTDGDEDTKTDYLTVNVSANGLSDSAPYNLSQEGLVLPVFSWNGGVSIGRNDGIVSITQGNSATQPTVSPTSFAVRTTNTPNRTVTVSNVTIPSGFQNPGTTLDPFNVSVQQLAAQELLNIVSSTGTSVSGQGENFTITVDTTDIYDTQWEGFITYTDPSNTSNWVGLSAGNTGTGDDEFFVFVDPNYAGSNGYDGTQRNFDIRVDKVGGGVSSNTISFYQNTGTAPVIKPSVSVSPTSRTWTYSQSGTSEYQTITAYHDGGNAPTSVSFYVSGIHFGLVQHDPNVPVNVTGGPWVAEATSTSGVSSYSVGIYPLTQNDGTSNKEETVTVSMGNSGGTTPATAQMIQGFNIDWETNVSSLSFGTGGGTQYITLTTDLSWTAAVSGTGFSINTTSGTAGTRTISVTATQKDLGGGGTVTFSASGQSDIVVSLSQAAAPLEYDWFLNGLERIGSVTVTPSTTSTSYSVGLYAYRGSTAVTTTWMLQRTSAGSWIDAATTTSGTTSFATTTSTQNTNGTPYLYLNIETNTDSARSGQAEITVDGIYVGTIYVNQDGVSGGSGGGDRPGDGGME